SLTAVSWATSSATGSRSWPPRGESAPRDGSAGPPGPRSAGGASGRVPGLAPARAGDPSCAGDAVPSGGAVLSDPVRADAPVPSNGPAPPGRPARRGTTSSSNSGSAPGYRSGRLSAAAVGPPGGGVGTSRSQAVGPAS